MARPYIIDQRAPPLVSQAYRVRTTHLLACGGAVHHRAALRARPAGALGVAPSAAVEREARLTLALGLDLRLAVVRAIALLARLAVAIGAAAVVGVGPLEHGRIVRGGGGGGDVVCLGRGFLGRSLARAVVRVPVKGG